jgi:hypothetical protein
VGGVKTPSGSKAIGGGEPRQNGGRLGWWVGVERERNDHNLCCDDWATDYTPKKCRYERSLGKGCMMLTINHV